MEMPEKVNASPARQVWNAGRTVGAKRALKPKQIWEIRFFLNQHRRCGIERCSTLPSIASFVIATLHR